jgi:hypothetical protein
METLMPVIELCETKSSVEEIEMEKPSKNEIMPDPKDRRMLTEADLEDIERRLSELLRAERRAEAERDEMVAALISLFCSVADKAANLRKAFVEMGAERKRAGRCFRKALEDSATAIRREVEDLLGRYGIRIVCQTGPFDLTRHMALGIRPTDRKELDGQISRVISPGFVTDTPAGIRVVREQLVEIWKLPECSRRV